MSLDLGRVGLWSVDLRTAAPAAISAAATELDDLGWGALWIPGLGGGDLFGDLSRLLTATRRTVVATGVASIWRHPAAEFAAFAAAHSSRLLLGLGVSDAATATGGPFRPLQAMTGYLDALDAAGSSAPRVLGAMGPAMTDLARRRASGTHPFLVTPAYIEAARTRLGAGALLAPYQAVTLERDPAKARAAGRAFLAPFFGMGAYRRSLLTQGFSDADLASGGSDRLVDAVLAWGDVDAVGKRVAEHLAAGADHVALHVVGVDGLPLREWRELAALISG
ncbi:TIGR03620 family F420-dependent LLM class oxidoreductase [Amycolatopsis rhabdoformis]|uniref:TIGR03620 family F420-dependent LLM class oxidoreductase n=1 Tax=Amycolatopsis rhabdoformis TaxID=1448059 RepID=A0ABZ1IDT7_9PSEU|nr:TIGR03620 family F420-dependent LLM class oxidoreductase [Amycolatopsis rhabdoformis]WSE31600.1 TIGR03620 family F420-dependent LLM class oxidoreductase [Amycolatopsis rhabdoformis]